MQIPVEAKTIENGVMYQMTVRSRHRIRNSIPKCPRPNTLPLGHRGSLPGRSRDLRCDKQAVSTTTQGLTAHSFTLLKNVNRFIQLN